jgi:hypothetical protein
MRRESKSQYVSELGTTRWSYVTKFGLQLLRRWRIMCWVPIWESFFLIWWNEDWQGKPKYSEKTCPSATLSTTNPTWPNPGSNPGRRGGKSETNRFRYGAVYMRVLVDYGGQSLRNGEIKYTFLSLRRRKLCSQTFDSHCIDSATPAHFSVWWHYINCRGL